MKKKVKEQKEERQWVVEYKHDTIVAYVPKRIKKIIVFREKNMYEVDLTNKLS